MTRRIIDPFEPTRAKTNKIGANMDELGIAGRKPNLLHPNRRWTRDANAALGTDVKPFDHPRVTASKLNAGFVTLYDTPTPLVSADFKNGVYSINGASRTAAQVWRQDLAGWGAAFSTSDIVGGTGYNPTLSTGNYFGPIMSVEAYAAVSGGFVCVYTIVINRLSTDNTDWGMQLVELPGYSAFYESRELDASGGDLSRIYTLPSVQSDNTQAGALVSGTNKKAVLFNPATGLVAQSINGQASVSFTSTSDVSARNALGFYHLGETGAQIVTESMVFYSLASYGLVNLQELSS